MKKSLDIQIKESEWIKWINVTQQNTPILNIDEIISPLNSFWHELEIYCVSACCGIDAFSFLPKDIKKAKKNFDDVDLLKSIDDIIFKINKVNNKIIDSRYLNIVINKKVFLDLLKHIKETIKEN